MKEIISIIPKRFRPQGVRVTVSIVIRAIFNFMGIAILIPILLLILDPEAIQANATTAKVFEMFGFSSHKTFALVACILVIVLLFAKFVVNLWLQRSQRKYISKL